VPVDPTTQTLFTRAMIEQVSLGRAPFAAYVGRYGQSYPMWDELAVAVWLDPGIVTHGESLLVDVDTSFTAGYGNTLSWSPGEGPGLGESLVTVVLDIDRPRFESLVMRLLTRAAGHD
jgi:purine nucleosidase